MIGEVTEKVLASIADSADSLPDDYTGSDGLLYCGRCNTRKEREIIWFDNKPKKVPVMLDKSPMRIKRLQVNNKADYLKEGQLFVTVHYGLLRYKPKEHMITSARVSVS